MQTEIDLKLLKIINTLFICGSVTKTAQTLNLSPGTISYALNKARTLTGAHLFIRTRSGMKPDTTARELCLRYQKFTGTNQDNLFAGEESEKNILSFMTYSPVEMMLVSNPARCDALRYHFSPYNSSTTERLSKLKSGEVDIDIGAKLPAEPLINKVKLFTTPVSLLVSGQNQRYGERLTLDEWQTGHHAVWSVLIDYYCNDALKSQRAQQFLQERKVKMISGSIVNMVTFCAASDCMMMIPDYFTPLLTKNFAVRRVLMPEEIEMHYDCYCHFSNSLLENANTLKVTNDIVRHLKSAALASPSAL